MPYLPSIKSAKNLKNKTVLVRCDFDVPIDNTQNSNSNTQKKKIKIKDDSRLKTCIPTIEYLLKKQVKQIILIGHLGRPKGQIVPELSLAPVAEHLEKLLNSSFCHSRESGNPVADKLNINFIKNVDNLNKEILKQVQDDKKLVMIENLRFNPGEEKNDKNFAKQLASLADIYINESFANSHRNSASVAIIKKYLPSYAGLNLEAEMKNLTAVLQKPKKPFVAIIGGAKIETKLPVINQFLKTANYVLVGGAVANDFLLAQGKEVGESLVDKDYIDEAKKILKKLRNKEIEKLRDKKNKIKNYRLQITDYGLLLPTDFIWHKNKILDIGPKTIKKYCAIIKSAKTIVWNGPMGYFEDKKFAKGTNEIAKAILNSKAQAVIGGGETGESIKSKVKNQKSKQKKNIFISTGGGAMLEFLGGEKLPGLKK